MECNVSRVDAVRKLQSAGLIECHRGHITLVDRVGLEVNCCECYEVVKKEYDRLLPEMNAKKPASSR